MSTLTFHVTGMSCAHCENAIRQEVQALPGIHGVHISAESGQLSVNAGPNVHDDAIIAAVDEAGYAAVRTA